MRVIGGPKDWTISLLAASSKPKVVEVWRSHQLGPGGPHPFLPVTYFRKKVGHRFFFSSKKLHLSRENSWALEKIWKKKGCNKKMEPWKRPWKKNKTSKNKTSFFPDKTGSESCKISKISIRNGEISGRVVVYFSWLGSERYGCLVVGWSVFFCISYPAPQFAGFYAELSQLTPESAKCDPMGLENTIEVYGNT